VNFLKVPAGVLVCCVFLSDKPQLRYLPGNFVESYYVFSWFLWTEL